jgi:hypothetical protein
MNCKTCGFIRGRGLFRLKLVKENPGDDAGVDWN